MPEKKTFEAYMNELTETVRQLENKDNTLDRSLELFEQGMHLTKTCREILDHAQQRVDILLKDPDGTMHEDNFTAEENQ
jgi:exodeoxyribonuclease VII small subunit